MTSSNIQIPETNYLALGDSYTIGEGVAYEYGWPYILSNLATKKGISLLPPTIIAKTGWTTDELLEAIQTHSSHYEWVSLLIGVNNQYRGYAFSKFEIELAQLIEKSLFFNKNNPNKIILVSIPDYGVTPFAALKNPSKITAELDKYNECIQRSAEKHHCHFVDITAISRKLSKEQEMLIDDQLHPSAKQYQEWANEIANLWR